MGYPLHDVKGFIRNKGNDWLLSGYWKVYANAEHAAALFDRYEYDRDLFVRAVARGRDIIDLINDYSKNAKAV